MTSLAVAHLGYYLLFHSIPRSFPDKTIGVIVVLNILIMIIVFNYLFFCFFGYFYHFLLCHSSAVVSAAAPVLCMSADGLFESESESKQTS